MSETGVRTFTDASGNGFKLAAGRCPLPEADGSRVLWFLDGAFGLENDICLGPTMKGLYEDQSRNWFFRAETGGRVVSTCWYVQPEDDPSLGCFGEVYTSPDCRGRGLAKELNRMAIEHFEQSGGKLLMLATGNPVAAKLYESLGFRPYPKGFMRRFTPGSEGFLEKYFSADEVTIRPVRYGDMARAAVLLNEPNPWVSACLSAGVFSPNWYCHNRCGSLFAPLWRRTKGLWLGMFTQKGAMVGFVTMESLGAMDAPGHVILDLFVYPAFTGHAGSLLRKALDFGRKQGVASFGACLAEPDVEKTRIIEQEGFVRRTEITYHIRLATQNLPVGYWQ